MFRLIFLKKLFLSFVLQDCYKPFTDFKFSIIRTVQPTVTQVIRVNFSEILIKGKEI